MTTSTYAAIPPGVNLLRVVILYAMNTNAPSFAKRLISATL